MNRRRIALILLLIVDVGFVLWGGMAAAFLHQLLGPHGQPILPAGYEGYTSGSWAQLVATNPMAARYMEVLFRMYGIFNLIFGVLTVAITLTAFRKGERWAWWALLVGNLIALVSATRYDWIVRAIGPFELTEYLGLVFVLVALALTAPFFRPAQMKAEISAVAAGDTQ
jgi:hypothetical protein